MWVAQQANEFGPGDIATWAAAGIALLAALIAAWQAREARKSRKAAETQADAAAEQVKIMRADRDDRSAPEFVLEEAVDSSDKGLWCAKITVCMERGPRLASVTVTAHGEYIHDAVYADEYREHEQGPFTNVRPGSYLTVYVGCDDGYIETAGSVDLECVEDGGEGRTWHRGVGFTIEHAVRPRVRWA